MIDLAQAETRAGTIELANLIRLGINAAEADENEDLI